jgi:hypothetical protein
MAFDSINAFVKPSARFVSVDCHLGSRQLGTKAVRFSMAAPSGASLSRAEDTACFQHVHACPRVLFNILHSIGYCGHCATTTTLQLTGRLVEDLWVI